MSSPTRRSVVPPRPGLLRSGPISGLVLVAAAPVAAGFAAGGCAADGSGRADVSLVETRDTVGDTTIVRIAGGSIWGGPAVIEEELSIGVLEGPEELTFGFITNLTPDLADGIFVFDQNVPALRYYDSAGNHVRKVAGEGAGPGEYLDAVLGLGVRRDGRLVMRDARNGRLNVYEPDGTPSESWRVASGLFTSNAMTLDTLDHVYLKILFGQPQEGEPWPIGLLHLDDAGQIVDSIAPPEVANPPAGSGNGAFLPTVEWAFSPYRALVVGVTDRYTFEIRSLDGAVVRVEREWERIPLHAEEREQAQARLDWQWERQGQFMTSEFEPVPAVKPVYRGFQTGLDGTIWVRMYTEAEYREPSTEPGPDEPPPSTWVEPVIYHVYESDGTFLGEARMPARTSISVFTRDLLWGVRRGDLDEQYVVRLRVGHEREVLESMPTGG